ncbi:unnamed protein product [Rotaria sp. Silwood1]|nr:unnamed protein product [Rotaria sp. Silwood1]
MLQLHQPTIFKSLTDQECLLSKELRLSIVSLAINDDTYELVISNVTLEDKGNYKVIVLNPLEDKESQCKITVIESTDLKCNFPE